MEYTDEQKELMYLDYFNNFLTTDVFRRVLSDKSKRSRTHYWQVAD